jgi:hypothetical protein
VGDHSESRKSTYSIAWREREVLATRLRNVHFRGVYIAVGGAEEGDGNDLYVLSRAKGHSNSPGVGGTAPLILLVMLEWVIVTSGWSGAFRHVFSIVE